MSAATQQWLVFSAERFNFAIGTHDIIEIVPVSQKEPEKANCPGVLGWIDVEGDKVPVIDLVHNIHQTEQDYQNNEIIVCKGKDQLVGLMAERVIAVTAQGKEKKLSHCIAERSFLEDVHYLKPTTLGVIRHS